MPIDDKLFNFNETTRRVNGLEAMIRGLEAAKVEAIMFGSSHKVIDANIARYKKRLDNELRKEQPPTERAVQTVWEPVPGVSLAEFVARPLLPAYIAPEAVLL